MVRIQGQGADPEDGSPKHTLADQQDLCEGRSAVPWQAVDFRGCTRRFAGGSAQDRAAPHNLPLVVFAKLAGKSRPQINREIEGRRLLSLAMGNRGQRIPDWQLDPVRQEFIQSVLQRAEGVDGWTLYHALSEPHEVLEGRSPVEAVTACNLGEVANAVFSALGLN
jgi:hypothetical protein